MTCCYSVDMKTVNVCGSVITAKRQNACRGSGREKGNDLITREENFTSINNSISAFDIVNIKACALIKRKT
ncbi:uncharacterized protein EpC_29170 [Erwinia pyrifoliae Ep1/96]|nr:uncharacterized protein EpC_29170 [Erwinia pyrifoliae Ep1/96]